MSKSVIHSLIGAVKQGDKPSIEHIDTVRQEAPLKYIEEFNLSTPEQFSRKLERGDLVLFYMFEGSVILTDMRDRFIILENQALSLRPDSSYEFTLQVGAVKRDVHGILLVFSIPEYMVQGLPVQHVTSRDIGKIDQKGVLARIILGEDTELTSPIRINLLDIALDSGMRYKGKLVENDKPLIYVVSGQLMIEDIKVSSKSAVLLKPGFVLEAKATQPSRFMFLSVEELGKSVVGCTTL